MNGKIDQGTFSEVASLDHEILDDSVEGGALEMESVASLLAGALLPWQPHTNPLMTTSIQHHKQWSTKVATKGEPLARKQYGLIAGNGIKK